MNRGSSRETAQPVFVRSLAPWHLAKLKTNHLDLAALRMQGRQIPDDELSFNQGF